MRSRRSPAVSADEVVARHAARRYRVFMLGFLPGFAYMGTVDDPIAAPRRATPRVRVPAGSVGIAGRQTGIYPRESPGGWQIIGRTPLDVLRPDRAPAALLAPGDTVRFVTARSALPEGPASAGRRRSPSCKPDTTYDRVTVLRPVCCTTVQDIGRWGHQAAACRSADRWIGVSHGSPTRSSATNATPRRSKRRSSGLSSGSSTDAMIAVAGADLGARSTDATSRCIAPVQCRPAACCASASAAGRARVHRVRRRHRPSRRCWAAAPRTSSAGWAASTAGRCGRRSSSARRRRALTPAPSARHPHVAGHDARSRRRAAARAARPQLDYFPAEALEVLQRTRFTITPAVRSHGLPSDRAAHSARRRPRDDLGRDVRRRAPGAAVGRSDPADGRSADDRRLSADRHGDHGRSAAGRPARARRLDRVRDVLARTRRCRRWSRRKGSSLRSGERRWRRAPTCRWRRSPRSASAGGALVHRASTPTTSRPRSGGASEQDVPLFVLGGGSNLVIADEGFDGLVLQIGIAGSTCIARRRRHARHGGRRRDLGRLVATAVDRGLAGLECLSGIPGTRRRHADPERRRLRPGGRRAPSNA